MTYIWKSCENNNKLSISISQLNDIEINFLFLNLYYFIVLSRLYTLFNSLNFISHNEHITSNSHPRYRNYDSL